MPIELTKITESYFQSFLKVQKLAMGAWLDISKAIDLLSYAKHLGPIYNQACQWVIRKIMYASDPSHYILQYRKLDQRFLSFLQKHFENNWYRKIPISYRYQKPSWFGMIFASHLFLSWHQDNNLLQYFWLLYHLEHCQLEDIRDYWYLYEIQKKKLEERLFGLYQKSWFWHWVFRRFVKTLQKDIKSYHEEITSQVSQKLIKEDPLRVLKTICKDDNSVWLFQFLPQKNQEALILVIKTYYPKWWVLFKVRLKLALDPREEKDWQQFWKVYFFKCVEDAKEDFYLYGLLSLEMMKRPYQDIAILIKHVFEMSMPSFPYFWYQCLDLAVFMHNKELADLLRYRFSNWYYPNDYLPVESKELEVTKIPMSRQLALMHLYNQQLDTKLVRKVCSLLKTPGYLFYTRLGFKQLRGASVLWQGVDLVLNLPPYTESYINNLVYNLNMQKHLPKDIAEDLEAYMVTLGVSQWCSHWSFEHAYQIILKTKNIEHPIWKRGMLILEDQLTDVRKEERSYDIQ